VWQHNDVVGKRINNAYLAGSLVAEVSRANVVRFTSCNTSDYASDGWLVWQHDEAAGKRIDNIYLAGSPEERGQK